MQYKLTNKIKNCDTLRCSFMNLSSEVFGLSFNDWYKNGYWTDKYIPYALTDGNKVVSNASVNIMDTVWQGKTKRYIQIGTVMTDPKYRNQGCGKFIIQKILSDWKDKCDCIYLFANSSVLNFYPKFGFIRTDEYQYGGSFDAAESGDFRKLDMNDKKDIEILEKLYRQSNPFSALPMNNNYGLLMFYCGNFMKDCVYYSENYNIICIMESNRSTIYCYDIFGNSNHNMQKILSSIGNQKAKEIVLGFTPKNTDGLNCNKKIDDDYLFIFKDKENIFNINYIMFPTLSHA